MTQAAQHPRTVIFVGAGHRRLRVRQLGERLGGQERLVSHLHWSFGRESRYLKKSRPMNYERQGLAAMQVPFSLAEEPDCVKKPPAFPRPQEVRRLARRWQARPAKP